MRRQLSGSTEITVLRIYHKVKEAHCTGGKRKAGGANMWFVRCDVCGHMHAVMRRTPAAAAAAAAECCAKAGT